MRAWTLGVSIVFHLCVISAVVVAPLFATGDLPEPRRAAPEYILVTAPLPPDPARLRRPNTPAAPSTSVAPLTAPDVVRPETAVTTPAPGPIDFGVPGGEPTGGGFVLGSVVNGDPLPLPAAPAARKEPIRVGGDIRPPQRIRDVSPRYPAIAQASRVEGVVILEAVIAEDGSVRDVRVLRSKPLLDDAAVEAVRQWRFTPTLLNGQAVPVVMTVTVSFTLN
jgi:protein TonB